MAGSTSYYFRLAIHNRADHCIGTAYLCQQLLDILDKTSSHKVDGLLRKCVIIGGLLHDLGHGPFSHLWEGVVHQGSDVEWTHEVQSQNTIEFMIQDNNIKLHELPHRHNFALRLISSLITGDKKAWAELLSPQEFYITEIVSNKLCNIDVDKVDYILRDQSYLSHIILKPFSGFLDRARVVFDAFGVSHIGYNVADFNLIENMFFNRAYLHMNAYQHRQVAGCEKMVTDICVKAAAGGVKIENLPLTEVHKNQSAFLKLDDSVLDVIKESGIDNPLVKEAQKILEDLDGERYYECVWESKDDGMNIYNSLVDKFGDVFCTVGKKIPAADVPTNIMIYNESGLLVPMTSSLELSFESTLIFCKVAGIGQSAKEFTDSLNNNV